MKRGIEPSRGEVESNRLRKAPAQRFLAGYRERSARCTRHRPLGLADQDSLQETRQERCIIVEKGVDLSGLGARLVKIQQSLVRWQIQRRRLGRRGLPDQAEHFGEMREDGGKIIVGPRRPPDRLGFGCRAAQRFDEIGRDRRRMCPLPPHPLQIGGLPVVERQRIGFGTRQRSFHCRLGHQLMRHQLQCRYLFAPRGSPARGHHHRHVPAQHSNGLAEQREAPKAVLKLEIGVRHSSSGLRSNWRW